MSAVQALDVDRVLTGRALLTRTSFVVLVVDGLTFVCIHACIYSFFTDCIFSKIVFSYIVFK